MRPRPLETLNLATLAVVSTLTLVLWRRLHSPGGLLLRYSLMAAAVLIVVWLWPREKKLPSPVRVLLDFYPTAFIPVLYETLGDLISAARGPARDDLLIAADRALFGVDVTVWMQRFVRPGLSTLFYLAYTSYYFLALALGVLFWLRDKATLRRYIFTLTFVYLVSYAGYFVLPALGPRYALAARHTVPLETTAVSRAISGTLDELEHTKFDVFPSGHTMVALTVLLVSFRRARVFFWWVLPIAVCLVISTVYCRYHYVVDVIAGAVLALIAVPVGDRLYDRWLDSRQSTVASIRSST
ncbi:MAG TPA: phosphatase PAP2 family protein [Thermoanaerobaculia bacterium]|nr:phosphatase PAP2 family protein [Thermoanaerobaculia bacterium]